MRAPQTKYAKSGDLSIAYQQYGEGPDLVVIPGFVSHLDLFWEDPNRAAYAARLGAFARVTVFDKRGTGLSDRITGLATMEERMDDIRAVMDAAGLERAAVLGVSEGGPLALLFAAAHPDRVTALVLLATYARMDPVPGFEKSLEFIEAAWGTGRVLPLFGGVGDTELAARVERSSATPRTAAGLLRMNISIDVTSVLSSVQVPTLVFHRTGDPIVPVERGRELTAAIGGAKLVELPGDSHALGHQEDWGQVLDEVEEFLTGARRVHEPDRVLATVVFTDIVDSTATAARLGDERWHRALENHLEGARRCVDQYRGRQVRSTGDGLLATFDGPARAVRAALALVERAERDGLPIRAGVHTGEIELMGEDIGGLAVHLAKRVESAASPGEVWVSQTVRDLTVGSGIEFDGRGEHELKGVPGEWRLYKVESA